VAEWVTVGASFTMSEPGLRAYLNAPAGPASAWPAEEWSAGLGPPGDAAEVPYAVRACDRWFDGDDHAAVLGSIAADGELALGHDGATGSLTVDFTCRADFRLPTLIRAFTLLRGAARSMTADDGGLIRVEADWSDAPVLMLLAPGRSWFPGRDARELLRAGDREFDIRCAVGEAAGEEPAGVVLGRLSAP
jgi:hypothetical protein